MPELNEIRTAVEWEWTFEQKIKLQENAYQKLLKNYEVIYESEGDED